MFRRLSRTPLFTVTAVLTLALGLGAAATMFTLCRGILVRPLPFDESEQLVAVRHSARGLGLDVLGLSPATYFTYRDLGHALEQLGLWDSGLATISHNAATESAEILNVTAGFLDALRVAPIVGRRFSAEDDSPAAPRRTLISHSYWVRAMNRRPDVIGRILGVDGLPVEIIGVLPPGFTFYGKQPTLLLACRFNRAEVVVGFFRYNGIARLRQGVTIAGASTEFAQVLPRIIERFPMPAGYDRQTFEEMQLGAAIAPLRDDVTGAVRRPLWALLGSIVAMLGVACLNIAQLSWLRAEQRSQETAIRLALGANRTHLVTETALEAAAVVSMALVVAWVITVAAIATLHGASPSLLIRFEEVSVDRAVVLFLLFGGFAAFAIIAAPFLLRNWHGSAVSVRTRTIGATVDRRRVSWLLAATEIAGAVVIVLLAGSMARSFLALTRVDIGLRSPDTLLTLRISIPASLIKEPQTTARTYQQIAERLRSVPGVESIGLSSAIAMDGIASRNVVYVDGFPGEEGRRLRRFKWVAQDYFQAIGQRVVAGRALTWSDSFDLMPVAMVSENLAVEYWGQASTAIGKRIRRSPDGRWRTIVGVASDVWDDGPEHPPPATAYWPVVTMDDKTDEIRSARNMVYAVRSARASTVGFLDDIRSAIAEVAPSVATGNVQTLEMLRWRQMSQQRTSLIILAMAAGTAMLLAVIGIYGVVASTVSGRIPEIGLRTALGASRRGLLFLFVRGGAQLAGAGIVVGLTVAFVASRLLASTLAEFGRIDGWSYVLAVILVAVPALLAAGIPAARAMNLDPTAAMRSGQ